MALSKDFNQCIIMLEVDKDNMSVAKKVEQIAPLLNVELKKFNDSKGSGAEAFSAAVVSALKKTGLCKRVWMQVDHIGVHPSNREKTMLIAIEVHILLKNIAKRGWVSDKANILACKIPDGNLGETWKQKNVTLARNSNGLLPAYNTEIMTCVTGRGSHTVGAIRVMKYGGVRAVHPQLKGEDGKVSKSKICEAMPSMRIPMEEGVPVDLIEAELAVACPMMMEILSRVDNAHQIYRQQTALQNCNRIHGLLQEFPDDDDELCEKASVGIGDEFAREAKRLLVFVRGLAGGKDPEILKSLEAYEQAMEVKRKLKSEDLEDLVRVELLELERFLPAMVKAKLNSPEEWVDGQQYSILFPAKGSDISSIGVDGRNRSFAVSANKMMNAAHSFMRAYGQRIDTAVAEKLLSDLEVRCVMFIFGKTSNSRKEFNSLTEIAAEFYAEALQKDDKLPKWSKLAEIEEKHGAQKKGAKEIRETRMDGTITNAELERRGFVVDAKLLSKQEDDDWVYTIKSLDNVATVTLQALAEDDDDEDAEDDEPFTVDRLHLIQNYQFKPEVTEEVYHHAGPMASNRRSNWFL